MGREHVEITAQSLYVRLEMRHRLCAVDNGDHAVSLGLLNQRCNRVHRAQDVGHVRQCQYPGAVAQQTIERVQIQFTLWSDLDGSHLRARALGHHLPGHDVGVMFHMADENFVTRLEAAGQAIGHHVDGLGGATGPDNLAGAVSVQERANLLPGALEGAGGAVAKRVGAPMDVGMHFPVIAIHGVQHGDGLL